MQLNPNTLLQNGKYKIERVLGQGGFGITYLATQVMLDRKVCIKEFFFKEYCDRTSTGFVISTTSNNKEIVARFLNKFLKEARTISRLDHSNIIRILDIFEENGTAYYVMEYIDGCSLEDKVNRQGVLSENEAVEYIKQVGNALDYIHQQRINHLDVKPANIMIRKSDNKAILIDFGVSKQYDEQGGQTSTTPVGISYGYAPMEQYNPGGVSTFSPQTDIYSLGATLYKLVTGKIPPQAMEIFNMGLSGLPHSLSSNLLDAIQKAMQPRRNDRPQYVKDFLNMLSNTNTYQKTSSYNSSKILTNETTVLIKPTQPQNEINGHEYIDLGLPSGLKWATCNIGASKPEEYGDYFAWGEADVKRQYIFNNCKTMKYYVLLSKTVNKDDCFKDTASVNWGKSWRLPTRKEFEELENRCTWTWMSEHNVNGFKVTGPNGNSIFLPAAGMRLGLSCEFVGNIGRYWSSSPYYPIDGGYNQHGYAYCMYISDGHPFINREHRSKGISIRPVID